MAKNKEKLMQLKKQQKERTEANKRRKESEQAENKTAEKIGQTGSDEAAKESHEKSAAASHTDVRRDYSLEQQLFLLNGDKDREQQKKTDENWKPENQFEKDMQKGVTLYRRWNYTGAVKEFFKVLEKYPDRWEVYYYIANAFSYMAAGIEYSLRFYEKALELSDNLEIWLDYGNILRVAGRKDEAERVLMTAREKFPEDGAPAMLLAAVYDAGSRRNAAVSESRCKKCLRFNREIREWESRNQLLKPEHEDFV